MNYLPLREELKAFYWNNQNEKNARAFSKKCFAICEERVRPEMSVPVQKMLQEEVIAEEFDPVIFKNAPYYYESGVLVSLSDGAFFAKGWDFTHAAGWVFRRNEHRFKEQDLELWARFRAQSEENMYLICGSYHDIAQHFNFNMRPILAGGLKSIYDRAQAELQKTEVPAEREFLTSVCHAMLQLKKAAEKFSAKAGRMLLEETDPQIIENLTWIRDTAKRDPWEKPQTLREALNTVAFLRRMLGTLEGLGPNTFGRLDMDLYPFYQQDVAAGRLDEEGARALIAQFLLLWDMHYDHDMKMIGYADHELDNTYTLGGCDLSGKPLYNELTKLFLQVTREEEIIFPKIKCRFSKESPKEYLDEINRSVIGGTSTILYQNDDACIPAILRSGRPIEEARDYMVSGCWGMASNGTEKYDHGGYLNLMRTLELPLHHQDERMEKIGIRFDSLDGAKSFEELYAIVLRNCEKLFRERMDITRKGGQNWHEVDAMPIFSSTLIGCMEKRRDFTYSGGKYRDDYLLCFGFPNIVDSLLAIKQLVFAQKKYPLEEYFSAVRDNWEGAEDIRQAAIHCPGWGDGTEVSETIANRFQNDLYEISTHLKGTYDGKVHIGHLTYTEIRWWAEKTLATPDGRRNGEYFSQGLTPSRLKRIPSVTGVIHSLKALDASTMAANNVVNIILPSTRIDLNLCEAFLRSVAETAIMSLQLNCVTKEQLLDAQKHPENYPNLIVRVCGFSARFTSLTPEWQQEVLTRNFYE